MGTICPICKKPGYIVKEKPRKKHETLTLRGWKNSGLSWQEYSKGYGLPRFMNKCHRDYSTTHRTRSALFKINHNYKDVIKDNKTGSPKIAWTNRFCYIGAPQAIIKKLKISIKRLHGHMLYHRIEKWPDRLEKQLDIISSKQDIPSEQYVRFLASLKFIVDHPTALRKLLGIWLDTEKQRLEKKANEQGKNNSIDGKVKLGKRSNDVIDLHIIARVLR